MGEIADQMVNGSACQWCGVLFEKEHGYPVICRNCFDNSTRKERRHIVKATEKEL